MSEPFSRRMFLTSAALAPSLAAVTLRGQVAPLALEADEGELLHVGPTRDPVRIKVGPAGRGRFAMITQEMAPGSRVPVHLHEREDEIIFIQRGDGAAVLGNERVAVRSGSTLYVPAPDGSMEERTGTYVTIWTRSADGAWQVAIAIGTPPVPRPKPGDERR